MRDLERQQAALLEAWARAPEPAALARLAEWRRTAADPAPEGALMRSVVIAAQLRSCREAVCALAEHRDGASTLRWARLASAALPAAALLAYNQAGVAALAGRTEEAAALLRPLLGAGGLHPEELAREPAFTAALATPEFRALVGPPPAP